MVQLFLKKFNGVSFFEKNVIEHTICLDACLTGMGAIFYESVYHLHTPEIFKNAHITALEMLNIFVAIKIFGKNCNNKTVNVFCDNSAVVSVL